MITYAPREHSKAIKERRIRLAKQQNHKKKVFFSSSIVVVVVLISGALGYFTFIQQLPKAVAQVTNISVPAQTVQMIWPAEGQAAVGTTTGKVLASTPTQVPTPTASVTKVMTALMITKKHPLKPGQTGPTITFSQADVERYYNYSSNDGSTTPVVVGGTLTEYQALQAILLPSANNVADSAAIWAYGSMDAYLKAANEYARTLGMKQSTFGEDASGFSDATKSTPDDLILLGQAALHEPVIKEIVAQKTADLPLAGTVNNVNSMIGAEGNIGIKTGNTEAAGGCFLFAAERDISGHKVTMIGAIMNAPNLASALADSQPLLRSAFVGFDNIQIVKKGTTIAKYKTKWGSSSNIVASKDLTVFGWKATNPSIAIDTPPLSTPQKPSMVGSMTAKTTVEKQTIGLELDQNLTAPPLRWRLEHLF